MFTGKPEHREKEASLRTREPEIMEKTMAIFSVVYCPNLSNQDAKRIAVVCLLADTIGVRLSTKSGRKSIGFTISEKSGTTRRMIEDQGDL